MNLFDNLSPISQWSLFLANDADYPALSENARLQERAASEMTGPVINYSSRFTDGGTV